MTHSPTNPSRPHADTGRDAWNVADCHYFAAGVCRSCTHLAVPYATQLTTKQGAVRDLLADHVSPKAWLPPVASPVTSFRSKVKLAVGGTCEAPTLGLNAPGQAPVDLRECPIQDRAIWDVVPDLAGFITYAGLAPYDVDRREGELKFILATANAEGDLLVRFVVRTRSGVEQVRAALPALLHRLPQIVAVSANLHPEHKAVVEGALEFPLTDRHGMQMAVGDVTVHLQHRSFIQTNTTVAGELYRQVAAWADAVQARSALDLYCGVGGFALHLATGGRQVRGVEIEPSAIESARAAVQEMGLSGVTFEVADADSLTLHAPMPDLIVVNPPRRGIGELAHALETSRCSHIVYSSCNPASLARDLARIPGYAVTAARLFDMFPHTDHAEVAVLLERH